MDDVDSVSCSFILYGGDTSYALEIRKLAAKCILSDPETFSEGVLGNKPKSYCDWLLNPKNWGGKFYYFYVTNFLGLSYI